MIKRKTIERISREQMNCRISVDGLDLLRAIAEKYLVQIINYTKDYAAGEKIGQILKADDVKSALGNIKSYNGSNKGYRLLKNQITKYDFINYFEVRYADVEPEAIELITRTIVGYIEALINEACNIAKHVGRITIRNEDLHLAINTLSQF